MPRPKKTAPSYRYHISGQAVVTFNQKNFYLGPYDSPESLSRYHSLVAQYVRSGGQTPSRDQHLSTTEITVADLAAKARTWIESKYGHVESRCSTMKRVCAILEDEVGDLPVSKFGPLMLAKIRDTFVASGNSRKYINHQIQQVIRIFKYGISQQLVTQEIVGALKFLEPLSEGEQGVYEGDPVEPVDLEVVRATAKHLSPTVRAMVALQVATAMRPSEICAMKPKDIDQTGEVWIYRLTKHKTAKRKKELKKKAVPIFGEARKALEPFLIRGSDEYCFKPEESDRWYREQRTLNRKTPPNCGNRVGSNRKESGKKFNPCYNRNSYRQAIERAAKKAKVDHWFPYQLRHMAATEVRDALGIEAAAALLGHSRTDMTDHYAKLKEAKAIEAAKVAPQLVV